MYVKYVIMFQVDGLDLGGVCEELKKYGKIDEIEDSKLDEDTLVKLVFMTSSMGNFVKLKLEFNCATAENNPYFLVPMASYEDMRLVMEGRA